MVYTKVVVVLVVSCQAILSDDNQGHTKKGSSGSPGTMFRQLSTTIGRRFTNARRDDSDDENDNYGDLVISEENILKPPYETLDRFDCLEYYFKLCHESSESLPSKKKQLKAKGKGMTTGFCPPSIREAKCHFWSCRKRVKKLLAHPDFHFLMQITNIPNGIGTDGRYVYKKSSQKYTQYDCILLDWLRYASADTIDLVLNHPKFNIEILNRLDVPGVEGFMAFGAAEDGIKLGEWQITLLQFLIGVTNITNDCKNPNWKEFSGWEKGPAFLRSPHVDILATDSNGWHVFDFLAWHRCFPDLSKKSQVHWSNILIAALERRLQIVLDAMLIFQIGARFRKYVHKKLPGLCPVCVNHILDFLDPRVTLTVTKGEAYDEIRYDEIVTRLVFSQKMIFHNITGANPCNERLECHISYCLKDLK